MAKIISICSEKGGVGKTTTALNVASGLVRRGRKVLMIDLDQQGNASRALGYNKDGKPTIAEVIYNLSAGMETDYEATIRHCENGIDYVPSSAMLTNITTFIAGDADSNYVVKRAMQEYNTSYDYIIIDCRTLLDLLVSNAMNASQYVIIPVECGVYSFDGLDKMLNKVTSINNSTNKDLRVLGILLNKNSRTNVNISVIDSVRESYPNMAFTPVVPYCPSQSEMAVISQKSCVEDKNSTIGKAFESVIDEILERVEGIREEPPHLLSAPDKE